MKLKKLFILLDLPIFVFNYVYLIICARILVPVSFGELNACLAILSITFVVGITLQVKVLSQSDSSLKFKEVCFYCFLAAIMVTIFGLISGYPLIILVTLSLICLIHPYLCLTRALFLKLGNKKSYYLSLYIEVLAKLALAVAVFYLKIDSVILILMTIFIGQILSLLFGQVHAKPIIQLSAIDLKVTIKSGLNIALNQFIFFVLLAIDIFLLNSFSVSQSGEIILAIRFCQIPILILFTVLQFNIKVFSLAEVKLKTLYKYILLMFVMYSALNLFLFIFGLDLINTFFGKAYVSSLNFIFHFSKYYFLLSILFIVSFYESIKGIMISTYWLIGLLILLFLVYYFFSASYLFLIQEYLLVFFSLIFILFRILSRRNANV